MIEAIVDYIQNKGFGVCVFPGVLQIFRVICGQVYSVSWAISEIELAQGIGETFFQQADEYMAQIDAAIAQVGQV